MKSNISFFKAAVVLMLSVFAFGCTDSKEIDNPQDGYGYISFKLYKDPGTRADELEYLHEAHKIQLSLSSNGQNLSPTLLVDYFDAELSEFGLTTESIQLRAGDYVISGYRILNKVDEVILYGDPGEDNKFTVVSGKMNVRDLLIKTVLRGHIEFTLRKDFSDFSPRANTRQEYTWSEIGNVRLQLEDVDDYQNKFTVNNVKTRRYADEGTSYVKIDSVFSIPAGTYKLNEISIYSGTSSGAALEYIDTFPEEIRFTVEDNKTTEADIPIKLQESDEYIKDYLALRSIWESLNGPEWSWYGETYELGSNWDFDKDIDLWGDQPGVALHNNGRVAAISIGQFGPKGDIPDAIGQLTEVTELWIGTNGDLLKGDEEDVLGSNGYDHLYPYTPVKRRYQSIVNDRIKEMTDRKVLSVNDIEKKGGEFPFRFRMADSNYEGYGSFFNYHKAQMRAARAHTISDFERRARSFRNEEIVEPEGRASSNVPVGKVTNGITGISKEIANLQKLTHLYISNTKVKELPPEMANLVELTDLELYNNPLMEKFPDWITELPELVALNIGKNFQWSSDEVYRGIDKLFNGASQRKIQIMYADQNNLKKVPESIKNLASIGLLSFSENLIEEVPPFTTNVRPVQFYFDFNYIQDIPANDQFADWRDSKSVTFAYNKFTKVPNIFNSDILVGMGSVDFSFNYITEFDGMDDGTLKGFLASTLNLSFNYFTEFPDIYKHNIEANYLILANNSIATIDPDVFRHDYAKYTSTLDLTYNKIKELPTKFSDGSSFSFQAWMPYLNGINLSNNRFDKFPTGLLTNTVSIFYAGFQRDADGKRCLTEWPNGLRSNRLNLRAFSIEGNDIGTVDQYPYLLTYFNVSDNPNLYMQLSESDNCNNIRLTLVYDETQNIRGCAGYINTIVNRD